MIIIISDTFRDLELEGVLFLDNICELKQITDKNNIIFIFDKTINDEGIIDNKYLFEEIFITLDCKAVITNKLTPKLQEICEFYDIPLYKI